MIKIDHDMFINKSLIILVLVMILSLAVIFPNASAESDVPKWVKNNAGWWATDAISETEFINAIEFLINQQIIHVSSYSSTGESEQVPDWVKNTAGWWATDAISETEFINAIEFLINIGIINVANTNCENDLQEYYPNDLENILKVCTEHNSKKFFEVMPYLNDYDFNRHGFLGPDFSEIKSPNTYRIFMVGGSTMLGSGNNSPETAIPGILQKIYDKQNLGMNVEVINVGISGGNILSEYELVRNVIFDLNPDLIIVLNGWNDLAADYSIRLIKDSTSILCLTTQNRNVDLIIGIQPIAGFSNKILTQQELVNSVTSQDHNGYQLIQAKSTYDFMTRELLSLNNCVYDLRNEFDDIAGPIYWDQGHIAETGNLLLAEKFFELSSKKIVNDISIDNKFHKIISKYNSPIVTSYLLSKLDIELDNDKEVLDLTTETHGHGNYFELKKIAGGNENILAGKDLRNIDLDSIDFNDADLSGANLSGHDLRNIDFSNSIIRGADLSNTNLNDQNFSGVDLRGINFSGASIKNGNFVDAKFSKPIQHMCDTYYVPIVSDILCTEEIIKNESIRTNFINSNLNGAKFGGPVFTGLKQTITFVNFSNSDLTNSEFLSASILGSNFQNAVLDNTKMQDFIIGMSDFSNANMDNFHMSDLLFVSVSFSNAEMTNGVIDMRESSALDINFQNANLQNTRIVEYDQSGKQSLLCVNNSICD